MPDKLITPEEVRRRGNDFIDSLEGLSVVDKYKIITHLHDSFMDMCKKEGIEFVEFDEEDVDETVFKKE